MTYVVCLHIINQATLSTTYKNWSRSNIPVIECDSIVTERHSRVLPVGRTSGMSISYRRTSVLFISSHPDNNLWDKRLHWPYSNRVTFLHWLLYCFVSRAKNICSWQHDFVIIRRSRTTNACFATSSFHQKRQFTLIARRTVGSWIIAAAVAALSRSPRLDVRVSATPATFSKPEGNSAVTY